MAAEGGFLGFKTKSQFESSHFRGATGNAASQLQSALISDPGHIVPDRQLSAGESQKRGRAPSDSGGSQQLKDAGVFLDLVKVPQDEIDNKRYGKPTEDAVIAFKKKLDIRRPGQQVADPMGTHGDSRLKSAEVKESQEVLGR